MSEKTYNLGRVVGWSAYEEFLKENPNVDPSVVTEQRYYAAVTYGTTRLLYLQISSGWTAHPATAGSQVYWSRTVAMPGADYGTVPIVGVWFGGTASAPGTPAERATLNLHKEQDSNFSHIYKCFASDSSGNPLSNATQTGGYVTFISTSNSFTTTWGNYIPLIIRGLTVNGLVGDYPTSSGEHSSLYLGPQSLVINKVLPESSVNVGLEEFTLSTTTHKGNYVKIEDEESSFYALSFASSSGTKYGLTGASGNITIPFSSSGSSLTEDVTYTASISWEEIIQSLIENKKLKFSFLIKKYDSSDPTYIDITTLFRDKYKATGNWSGNDGHVAFHVGFGADANHRYPVLTAWDGVSSSPTASPYDGWFRIYLKLYPCDFGTTSKFDLVIAGYLKQAITVTSDTDAFRGSGFYYRGKIPSDATAAIVAAHPAFSTSDAEKLTLIPNSVGTVSGDFIPSDPETLYWDTVPEGQDPKLDVFGDLPFLMGRTLQATQHRSGWGLNLEIRGASLTGTPPNDRLYGIDRSSDSGSADSNSCLRVYLGNTAPAGTVTWPAISAMTMDIDDMSSDSSSFYQTFSGIYTTI